MSSVISAYYRSSVQYTRPGISSYSYLGKQGVSFPVFDDELCKSGQDFIVQISPLGCTPSVVRSDLLEEQNVPVFCPLIATKLNPLIDVEAIDYISFSPRGYTKEVAGVGFHPARAALRGNYKTLLNSPVLENIGYAVIVLKKQKNESAMPDWVQGNLTAKIRYDIKNAFGVGKAVYYLPELDDTEWVLNYKQYGFWQGRGFLRAEDIDKDSAFISIYSDKNNKVSGVRLKKGETSREIYIPGFYCFGGMQLKLHDLDVPDRRAKLNVNGEIVEVAKGEKFLDNKCRVKELQKYGLLESVSITCEEDDGINKFDLTISPRIALSITDKSGSEVVKDYGVGDKLYEFDKDGKKEYVYIGYIGTAIQNARDGNKRYTMSNSYREDELIVYLYKTPQDKGEQLSFRDISSIGKSINSYLYWISGPVKRVIKGEVSEAVYYKDEPKEVWGKNKIKIIGFAGPQDKPFGKCEKSNDVTNGENTPECNQYETQEECESADAGSCQWVEESGDLKEVKTNYENALKDYRTLIESFPSEKENENSLETFGERAFFNSIRLAEKLGQKRTMLKFCKEFEESFPDSKLLYDLRETCSSELKASSQSTSTMDVLVNGRVKEISLERVYEPSLEEYSAEVKINGLGKSSIVKILRKNTPSSLEENGNTVGSIEILSLTEDSAKLRIEISPADSTDSKKRKFSKTVTLKLDAPESFDSDYTFTLTKINLKKLAKVSVIPRVNNAGTEANFSFKIGIEKRAIQLSPEQAKEKIKNLNESIEKWEKISNNLGNVVRGMKAACLMTGTALTIKNLFAGMKGKAGARHEATQFYREKCSRDIKDPDSPYYKKSVSQCLVGYNDEINSAVEIIAKKRMSQIRFSEKELCSDKINSLGSGLKNINSDEELSRLAKDEDIKGLFSPASLSDGTCDKPLTTDEAERVALYLDIINDDRLSSEVRGGYKEKLKQLLTELKENAEDYASVKKAQESEIPGEVVWIKRKDSVEAEWYGTKTSKEGEIGSEQEGTPYQKIIYNGVLYIVTLKETYEGSGEYVIKNIYNEDGKEVTDEELTEKIKQRYEIFKKIDPAAYKNRYENPEVKYWEAGEFKGLPAVVPFDIKNGWYAATKSFSRGTIKAYHESGAVNFFYICNVMKNNRQDGINRGDDKCVGFFASDIGNLKGKKFPGLTEAQTSKLLRKAIQAIEDASRGYKTGVRKVKIRNVGYVDVGVPEVNLPGTQCEDFMSPKDCNLLFNVCDPVICPSSRCNAGGSYYVSNVIRSGFVGSTFLCLHNFGTPSEGGVLIPVCLSGLKAAADGWLSILKSHRDCLQRNLQTGEMIGFCDEVYSIYVCDFFWKQALPLIKMKLPDIVTSMVTGRKDSGGGEYLIFKEAWENAGKSIDYMAQYYAENSYKAFILRSTDEIGSALCKSFISARYPASADFFDNLIEPDVPAQYNAWFHETPFTTATSPPTSQYKVFYHIYSGKDTGVYYSVYLKSPSGSSFYQYSETLPVARGFIPRGEYASETRDFTAPSGYQELCININGQEECGFGRVSTSFAMDYIEDKIVKDQIERQDIKSEKECISGSPSLYGLISPNLQAGAEQAIDPQIYNKGIVRVCSTENPGKGTNEERWVRVGYCDETKRVKCWLDKESINSVVEFNATREELKEFTDDILEKLREEGGYIKLDENDVREFRKIVGGDDKGKIKKLIEDITGTDERKGLIDRVFFSKEKATLYLLRGDAYARLAEMLFTGMKDEEKEKANTEEKEEKTAEEEKAERDEETPEDKIKESGPILPEPNLDPKPDNAELLDRLSKYDRIIKENSKKYGVSQSLIKAIISQESDAKYDAIDKKGDSYGLMGITEGAAKDVGMYTQFQNNKLRPSTNIEIGTKYYKRLEKYYSEMNSGEDLKKITLAAYNWGMGNIYVEGYEDKAACQEGRWVNCKNIPQEVLQYVSNVIAYEKEFAK